MLNVERQALSVSRYRNHKETSRRSEVAGSSFGLWGTAFSHQCVMASGYTSPVMPFVTCWVLHPPSDSRKGQKLESITTVDGEEINKRGIEGEKGKRVKHGVSDLCSSSCFPIFSMISFPSLQYSSSHLLTPLLLRMDCRCYGNGRHNSSRRS